MKKNLLLFLMSIIAVSAFSQSHHFKFKVKNKSDLKKLTQIISIDNFQKNTVWAYANDKEFEEFSKLNYKIEKLPLNDSKGKVLNMATTVAEMANWDRYPTYSVYKQMMLDFQTNYPTLCDLDTIGTTQNGRLVLVLKISDNVGINEQEPEFFYTSTMHGDETTGFPLMLRLADYLLSNYGTDPEATDIVNNFELYINPDANPDGTYYGGDNNVSGSRRSLFNGDDPNRDFPYPLNVNSTTSNPETNDMMAFASAHNFVMSANFHGGAEVYNYPWDCWTTSENAPADATWWEHIGRVYVDTTRLVNSSYMSSTVADGVTEGADWYYANGSRQDYMNYFHHCKEVTIELSSTKTLSSDQLPAYWNYNERSLINYIKEAGYGFNGTVKNINGDPLNAKIEITSLDKDNSWVTTDPEIGDYYRPIAPGTYNVSFSSFGYTPQTISITVSDWRTTTIQNVILGESSTSHTISGTITEDGTSNNIENVKIEVLNVETNIVYSLANGTYEKNAMEDGTYQVKASKDGYLSLTKSITISGSDVVLDFVLKPNVTITGTITENGTGNPLENVKVEILNSSIPFVLTNPSGQYSINNVPQESQQIRASLTSYSSVIQIVDISTTTTIDFTLAISNAISFETEVPSIFTFEGNANWTRVSPEAYDGTYSMKSGNISDNQTSVMQTQLNITSAGNITFFKKVSSESGYDFLKFYIDDIEKGSWSGEVDWSQESYAVTTGIHTFKWVYSKDGITTTGSDCAWIDYVEFPQYEILPTFSISGIITDAISGDPINNANVGLVGTNFLTTTLSDGTYTIENVQEGTYDLKSSADSYTNSIQNITLSGENLVNTNLSLNPSDLITFETNIPSDFSFSGDLNWTKNSDKAYDGFYSMKSGSIVASETTTMEVTKTTQAGTFSFYKFVSSESGYDYLHFYIDGSEKNTWSGTSQTTWDEVSYTVTEGTHTYKWKYTKDSGVNSGSDCAWVDFIDFPPAISSVKNDLSKNTKINISPNPFNENTSFEFYINKKSNVFIGIYSYNGQLVKTLLNNQVDSGNHRVIWNGRNDNNQQLANGLYFCKIINEGNSITEKIILMK